MMNRGVFAVVVAASLAILLAPTVPALAKTGGGSFGTGVVGASHTGLPAGFSHGGKRGWNGASTPPGWSQGKKTGWGTGTMPPGLSRH